jgi:hypothetical protein
MDHLGKTKPVAIPRLGDLPGMEFNPAQIIKKRGLPKGWKIIEERADGICWRNQSKGLQVIMSCAKEEDGKWWIHISLSRRNRMPSYEDLYLIRKLFVSKEDCAYQVFPPEGEHINIHPYCLHLWVCPGERVTPDFTRGSGMI